MKNGKKISGAALTLVLGGALCIGGLTAALANEGDKFVDMSSSAAGQAGIDIISDATDVYLLTLADQIAAKEANPDPTVVALGVTITAEMIENATEYSVVAIHEAAGVPLAEGFVANTENCLACHGDYGQLVEATSDYTNIYNPHESHYGQVDCYRCHTVAEDPQPWCNTCHVGIPVTGEGWTAYPQIGY